MKIGLIDVDGHNYPNLALMPSPRMSKMMLKNFLKVMFRVSVLPIRFGASWRVMARGVPPDFLPTKTNGGRTRNLPEHAPEDWELFKAKPYDIGHLGERAQNGRSENQDNI